MGYLNDMVSDSRKEDKQREEPEEEIPEEFEKGIKEELPSEKELVEEYGPYKIYRIPEKNEMVYTVPVPRPVGPEREILDTIKEAATKLITKSPEEIEDPEERREFYKKRVLEIIDSSPELGIPPQKNRFLRKNSSKRNDRIRANRRTAEGPKSRRNNGYRSKKTSLRFP